MRLISSGGKRPSIVDGFVDAISLVGMPSDADGLAVCGSDDDHFYIKSSAAGKGARKIW